MCAIIKKKTFQTNKKTENNFGVQVELNSEGKIQLEETANESIINGDANTTADVSDSTLDDTKNITQNSEQTDDALDSSAEPTAAVLSIDDPENGEIFKNHLISNSINNNHIPNKPENESASEIDVSNNIGTTTEKHNDGANGDVVNIDSDTKRLFNKSNTDAANAVGFHHQFFFSLSLSRFCYLIHSIQFAPYDTMYVIKINR